MNTVNTQLDSLLQASAIESIAVGIIKDGAQFPFFKGKLLNGEAPNEKTLYEIASLTKTFTGTLLAHAVAENKVQLDDDIRQYLTGSFPNLAYEDQPITFRHLVTHQSGLPHMFPNVAGLFDQPNWDELPGKINALQQDFSKAAFFAELQKVQLDTVPGTGLQYSNAGANLLGYLLEEVYDQPFDELLREKILTPLQMSNTEISLAKVDKKHLAKGQNANQVPMPPRVEKAMNAEGGIISNVGDMLKYLEYHLHEEDPVVTIAHQHLWDGQYGDFEAGLFWQINKQGDQPDRIFQNGGAFGTSSWVTLIPEEQIAVFMVTNRSGPTIHQKLSEVTEQIIKVIK